jgi:hypothetical protein
MTPTLNIVVGLDPALMKLIQSGTSSTIEAALASINLKLEQIMSTLADVAADMTEETTTIAGLSTFIQGLQAQIAALPGITPAVQAQIDGVFAQAEANKAALAAALTANTPPVDPNAPVPPIVT